MNPNLSEYFVSFHGNDSSDIFSVPNNVFLNFSTICGASYVFPFGMKVGDVLAIDGDKFNPNSLCPDLILSLGSPSDGAMSNVDGVHKIDTLFLENVLQNVTSNNYYKTLLNYSTFPGTKIPQHTFFSKKKLTRAIGGGQGIMLSELVSILSSYHVGKPVALYINSCFSYPDDDLIGSCGDRLKVGSDLVTADYGVTINPIGVNDLNIYAHWDETSKQFYSYDLSRIMTLVKYIYERPDDVPKSVTIKLILEKKRQKPIYFTVGKNNGDWNLKDIIKGKKGYKISKAIIRNAVEARDSIKLYVDQEVVFNRYNTLRAINMSRLVTWYKGHLPKKISYKKINNSQLKAWFKDFMKIIKKFDSTKVTLFPITSNVFSGLTICIIAILWESLLTEDPFMYLVHEASSIGGNEAVALMAVISNFE